MKTDPAAEARAGIEAALANIDNHVEVIRNMLTNAVTYTDDVRRRVAALEAALKAKG